MNAIDDAVTADGYTFAHYRTICRLAGEAARLKAARRYFQRATYQRVPVTAVAPPAHGDAATRRTA